MVSWFWVAKVVKTFGRIAYGPKLLTSFATRCVWGEGKAWVRAASASCVTATLTLQKSLARGPSPLDPLSPKRGEGKLVDRGELLVDR